ncbi:MAG: hypothetical protein QOH41_1172 [Blastocatellia bacterium]|jgi:hypothetical protein|nr:hypothetical protein [Blastocatellia bacterium]
MDRRTKLILGSSMLMVCVMSSTNVVLGQQLVNVGEVETTSATEEGYRRNGINIANLSAQLNTTNQRAFIIAHLGTGERSRQLNHRRLACIRSMLINSSPDKLTLAEGERVKGLGRIEVYLGSELMNVALLARNAVPCHRVRRRVGHHVAAEQIVRPERGERLSQLD